MVIVDVLYSYVWDVKSSKVKQKQKLHTKDNISAFFLSFKGCPDS